MSRKIKTLIIALGVLVLLGGGYYGSTIWKKKKAAATPAYTPAPKLGNLDSNALVKIELPGLVFEKRGEDWALISVNGGAAPEGIILDQYKIRGLTYSMASLWVERTVDEEPADLSVYGLHDPVRVALTDSSGKRVVYLLGDLTPSRGSYYLMEDGDPKVYSISSYTGEDMLLTLDKFRDRYIFPSIDLNAVMEIHLENGDTRIDIIPKPQSTPPHLSSGFTSLIITSPYKLTRGVDSQALDTLLTPLKNLEVAEFVEDHPASLSPYGLDRPAKLSMVTTEGKLDLLIGNQIGGYNFAKLSGAPGVFVLSGLDTVINVKPFSIIDKFPLLVNIDYVDHLTVSGGERPLRADFQGTKDEGVFFLDGKKAEEKSFKTWYQAVIGLLSDAEIPGPAEAPERTGVITIEYHLNTPPGGRASITLTPYNRDFYALTQEGTTEFLISRSQVNRIWETANAMVFD